MKRTCHGWSSGGFHIDRDNLEVYVRGVCTCSFHKHCVAEGKCRMLFESGGEHGAKRELAGLMGLRKVPKRWDNWRNHKAWQEREDNMEKFKKKFFKKCRRVWVTVMTE